MQGHFLTEKVSLFVYLRIQRDKVRKTKNDNANSLSFMIFQLDFLTPKSLRRSGEKSFGDLITTIFIVGPPLFIFE